MIEGVKPYWNRKTAGHHGLLSQFQKADLASLRTAEKDSRAQKAGMVGWPGHHNSEASEFLQSVY